MELITDPALVTPQWLTEALKTIGLLPEKGRVLSFEWESIDTGKMGDNARFRLCYDGNYKAPCTLIAKLPAADDTARAIAGGLGAYRKEVMFYKDLAGLSSIRTPEIYLALIDASGSNFILLMEDLSPAKPGNQLASETIEHAKQALSESAKLHAAFFGKDELLAREFSLQGLLITVLGAMFSQAEERSDQMFLVMIQRHLQHAVDMNAAEFL
jgi:hypothetical protein